MNTKDIGEVSEAVVCAELKKLGLAVLEPVGDNKKYDLVVEKNNKFIRLQVKTLSMGDRDNRVKAKLYTNNPNTNNKKYYSADDIDAYALYYPNNDQVYFVSIDDAPKTEFTLALDYKQDQKTINKAKDYELEENIKEYTNMDG